jgi:hypothetical protein
VEELTTYTINLKHDFAGTCGNMKWTVNWDDGLQVDSYDTPIVAAQHAFQSPDTYYVTVSAYMYDCLYYTDTIEVDVYRGIRISSSGKVSESVGTTDFTVTLSSASSIDTTMYWQTSNFWYSPAYKYSAFCFTDYDYVEVPGDHCDGEYLWGEYTGTLTIPAGQTSGTIPITIIDDFWPQNNRVFAVLLSNPSDGQIVKQGAVDWIADDELGFYISDVAYSESDGYAIFNVQAVGVTAPVTIYWATRDQSATYGDDYGWDLSEGYDYGSLSFDASHTYRQIIIPLAKDSVSPEADESFIVELFNDVDFTSYAEGEYTAFCTIRDGDSEWKQAVDLMSNTTIGQDCLSTVLYPSVGDPLAYVLTCNNIWMPYDGSTYYGSYAYGCFDKFSKSLYVADYLNEGINTFYQNQYFKAVTLVHEGTHAKQFYDSGNDIFFQCTNECEVEAFTNETLFVIQLKTYFGNSDSGTNDLYDFYVNPVYGLEFINSSGNINIDKIYNYVYGDGSFYTQSYLTDMFIIDPYYIDISSCMS